MRASVKRSSLLFLRNTWFTSSMAKHGASLEKDLSKETSALAADSGEEDLLAEPAISASEDEESSDNERKHGKLLEAISSLGARKRKKQSERSEASLQVSEFSVNAEGAGEKISLSDLLVTVEKTSGTSNKTKKQLKNLKSGKETLDAPLNKQQAEKIQRSIAYVKSRQEVSGWEKIIKENAKAQHLVFPLKHEPLGPKRVEQVVAGWKVETPLEQEVFKLLKANSQPVLDPVLTPVEEASLKAMSLEELTRKYHRIQKRAKLKEFLKNFEEMTKSNPQGALEELEKMEKSRIQERMSLKHQNSGKWAKAKAVMAKYDDSARKAMQEQLQINKDLTQKVQVLSEDDEEEEQEAVPDFVNDPEPILDAVNPWMRGRLTREEPKAKCEEGLTAAQAEHEVKEVCSAPTEAVQTVEQEEEGENEEEELIRAFERKRQQRRVEEEDSIPTDNGEVVQISDSDKEEEEGEEEEEEEHVSKFNSLFNLMQSEKTQEALEDGEGLDEGEIRVRNIEDLEVLGDDFDPQPRVPPSVTPEPAAEAVATTKTKEINLGEVLTKEANVIKVPFLPTVVDEEEHVDQISIIQEAFAGDDVVADFMRDKRKQEEASEPKEVDLTLPGWGEWGGLGIQPSQSKRKRFRKRMEAPPPRKDQKLPDVIISEKRNASIAPHQSTIRSPIGQTWNTQNVVKKMTCPKISTKMGAIIEPMEKEEFLKGTRSAGAGTAPDIRFGEDKREGRRGQSGKSQKRRDQKRK
ncbi:hypothetical protein DNTS_028785 [Danionella cerebrum]|uniref:UTP14C small subunit processome component n=1 Tax=Danionella cerebrum TaxID=2873325 RepID=A0A553Q9U0_9TELE|nr:hypothetical protein DNTS_028785 [Danionella translucida]